MILVFHAFWGSLGPATRQTAVDTSVALSRFSSKARFKALGMEIRPQSGTEALLLWPAARLALSSGPAVTCPQSCVPLQESNRHKNQKAWFKK